MSRAAIAALVHAYAERLDAGDLDGAAHLFTDATYRSGKNTYQGAPAVLAALRRAIILHDGNPRTKHLTTNLTIEVDEAAGTGTARCYFTILQATPTLPLQVIGAGRLHDRFVRAGDGWRFADRLLFIDLTGDVSQHLRPEEVG